MSAKKTSIQRTQFAQRGALSQSAASRKDHLPGTLVVKCKEDLVANIPNIARATVASLAAMRLPEAAESPFEFLRGQDLLREVIPVFSQLTAGRALAVAPNSPAAAFALSVQDSENEDLRGINVVRVARSADLKKIEKDLNNTPGIEYAHRVPARWMTAATAKKLTSDKFLAQQWALKAIGWTELDPLPDAGSVKVAVLDTGIDLTHPELKNIVSAYVHDGAGATDIVGHGTHVAGTIAAEINNQIGIAGVCKCDLMIWKIFGDAPDSSDGQFYVDEVMYQRALNAARRAGVKVVNLSIGGTFRDRTEEMLIKRLSDSGTLVVAAMGNEFQEGNPKEYPAGFPGVFAIGATTKTNQRAVFSNTGKHIALAAPGHQILSTLPMKPSLARGQNETEYAVWSGTSMATPHAAAAAALVFAKNPGFTPQQVAAKLKGSATKLPAMNGKKATPEFGAGLLNLKVALS